MTSARRYYTDDQRGAVRSELPVAASPANAAPTNFSPVALAARVSPDRADQRRVPHRVGPDGAHAQDAGGQRVDPQRRLAGRSRPAGAGGGSSPSCPTSATRLRRRITSTPRATMRSRANRLGGSYVVQLRLPARFLPAAAHPRRTTTRSAAAIVLEYQTFNFEGVPGVTVSAGPPLQHLVQPGRHRHLLELPRRARRPAAAMTSATGRPPHDRRRWSRCWSPAAPASSARTSSATRSRATPTGTSRRSTS